MLAEVAKSEAPGHRGREHDDGHQIGDPHPHPTQPHRWDVVDEQRLNDRREKDERNADLCAPDRQVKQDDAETRGNRRGEAEQQGGHRGPSATARSDGPRTSDAARRRRERGGPSRRVDASRNCSSARMAGVGHTRMHSASASAPTMISVASRAKDGAPGRIQRAAAMASATPRLAKSAGKWACRHPRRRQLEHPPSQHKVAEIPQKLRHRHRCGDHPHASRAKRKREQDERSESEEVPDLHDDGAVQLCPRLGQALRQLGHDVASPGEREPRHQPGGLPPLRSEHDRDELRRGDGHARTERENQQCPERRHADVSTAQPVGILLNSAEGRERYVGQGRGQVVAQRLEHEVIGPAVLAEHSRARDASDDEGIEVSPEVVQHVGDREPGPVAAHRPIGPPAQHGLHRVAQDGELPHRLDQRRADGGRHQAPDPRPEQDQPDTDHEITGRIRTDR